MTSIRIRRSTKAAAKIYAVQHDMTMQELIEVAITKYIDAHGEGGEQ